MARIVVVAVRIAIEVPEDADGPRCYRVAKAVTNHLMNEAVSGETPTINWEFDELGLSEDYIDRHINVMCEGYGVGDVVPYIRERHVN